MGNDNEALTHNLGYIAALKLGALKNHDRTRLIMEAINACEIDYEKRSFAHYYVFTFYRRLRGAGCNDDGHISQSKPKLTTYKGTGVRRASLSRLIHPKPPARVYIYI